MALRYATQQLPGFQNRITNIAITGIGGRTATSIATHLLATNRHRVTGLLRKGSTSKILPGVHAVREVDYNDHPSLVSALQGQDALLITFGAMAELDTSRKVIAAAAEAGVRWIMPNEWGIDSSNEQALRDTLFDGRIMPIREYIDNISSSSGKQINWISLCCGLWYEFGLSGGEMRFGFDFASKKLTLIDEGMTKSNNTTMAQVGRAVAALMSMKVLPDDENDASPCLAKFAGKQVYVSSFHVNQKEMFESVLRVTGDKESDWTITTEPSVDRYQRGKATMEGGNLLGWVQMLYTRMFYKDGAGDFNGKLHNEMLGLSNDDLDEATKLGIEIAASE